MKEDLELHGNPEERRLTGSNAPICHNCQGVV